MVNDSVVEVAAVSQSQTPPTKEEYMTAAEVRAALRLLFEAEQPVMRQIFRPESSESSVVSSDIFFLDTLVVPPTKYRPEARNARGIMESDMNSHYKNILQGCEQIRQFYWDIRNNSSLSGRNRTIDDLRRAGANLQNCVNSLLDKSLNPVSGLGSSRNAEGLKQILEKKEGLFRKNMMGKRVNYAARSVISPDPNIETNEIGVPPVFASRLTFPEPVTSHNYAELQQAVINGPYKWPGAVAIENEKGQLISLRNKDEDERKALANQLLAPNNIKVKGRTPKRVLRHLINGDVVLMNRQPTLHKPSMMAHIARVLPGEKTIRMHYTNCNTYNADFDGDEMNMHFPQTELGRAEALMIAATDNQYLSGTAGAPLRGLIQDHISMGVQLTNRDTFYNREDYYELLYACLRPEDRHTTTNRIQTMPPTIWKPVPLWTGKQLISTILLNLTPSGYCGLTLNSTSKTSKKLWGPNSEEGDVVFLDGHLLTGIIDKNQIGPASGGFVHAVYEIYGHKIAGRLLSVLGRLLTKVLHMRAFSCGVEDLVLTAETEALRREKVQEAAATGLQTAARYVKLDSDDPKKIDRAELSRRLEKVLRDDSMMSGLDDLMKGDGSDLTSQISRICLPDGLIKRFPKNHMQAMTASGAKGSGVNANQISCNLGQQVLEGRRVPTMVSGKTLPCFRPYEPSIRAGGFITDRFLTGVRPQEYYFHAMSGREGLIDTAVKTSRSGYLQRCLIKGMEDLKVEYDGSVRDADGSVVQFLYGEDGLDVTKSKFLTNFKFLAENWISLFNELKIQKEFYLIHDDEPKEWTKKAVKKCKRPENFARMDPALSLYPPGRYCGSTSETFYKAQKQFIEDNRHTVFARKSEETSNRPMKGNFEALLDVKYLKSVAEPGEAVGIVAGQSIGEPSTQMTLNTFHLAGHATKNVTLGIPRLREILMTASASISTPNMTLSMIPEITVAQANLFAKSISRLSLAEILLDCAVQEEVCSTPAHFEAKRYTVQLKFFPAKEYRDGHGVTIPAVLHTIVSKFLPFLLHSVRRKLGYRGEMKADDALPEIGEGTREAEPAAGRGGDLDDDGADSDEDGDPDSAKGSKQKGRMNYDDDGEDRDLAGMETDDDDEVDGDDEDDESRKKNADGGESGSTDYEEKIAQTRLVQAAARLSRLQSSKNTKEITRFEFDDRDGETCEFSFDYEAKIPKILVLPLVEAALRKALIHSVDGIRSCLIEETKDSGLVGHVDGVNLFAIREPVTQAIINPNSVRTNDIVAMLDAYGVEAARATIIQEMFSVFETHHIDVDHRHLNLIGDFMTRGGDFRPFNRYGFQDKTSPFLKMSFETTVKFLAEAVMEEDADLLTTPSSSIVMGKLSRVGTGSFDLLLPLAA